MRLHCVHQGKSFPWKKLHFGLTLRTSMRTFWSGYSFEGFWDGSRMRTTPRTKVPFPMLLVGSCYRSLRLLAFVHFLRLPHPCSKIFRERNPLEWPSVPPKKKGNINPSDTSSENWIMWSQSRWRNWKGEVQMAEYHPDFIEVGYRDSRVSILDISYSCKAISRHLGYDSTAPWLFAKAGKSFIRFTRCSGFITWSTLWPSE